MGMKKRSSPHKKRTTARRKKRAKQRKQASLQERLARLAKTQNPIASLTEALSKAPHSTLGLGKPEPEERRRRPKLGKPLLSTSIHSRDFPHYFGPQQPSAQQPGSVKISLSLPQRLIGARQIEFAVARRASALLWEKVPRRQWHYQRLSSGRAGVPLFELSPRRLTQAGGLNLSLLSDTPLSTAGQLTFALSTSTVLKHPPKKFIHQDVPHWPPRHRLSSADPSWEGSYQINLTALPLKPQNSPLIADSPPEAEQLSSEDKTGDIGHKKLVFKEFLREASKPHLASQLLRKEDNSIRKRSRIHQNPCLRKGPGRTKNWQHRLGRPRTGCRSRGAGTSDLFDRKQRIGSRWRLIMQAGSQQLLRELHEENNYDSHCGLFTQVASAAISRHHKPRVQPFPDATPLKSQNPGLIAGNPQETALLFSGDKTGEIEHKKFVFNKNPQEIIRSNLSQTSQSKDKKEDIGHKKIVFKIHPQETVSLNLNPATKHSRKTGGFIKRTPGYKTSAPREPLPEKVRSTQASDYFPGILDGIVNGEIPVPEDIYPAVLLEFMQQLAQKMAALTSLMELGDGYNDQQSVSYSSSFKLCVPLVFHQKPLLSA